RATMVLPSSHERPVTLSSKPASTFVETCSVSHRPASRGNRPTEIDAPVALSEERDHLSDRRLGPQLLFETVEGGRQRQALVKKDAKRLLDVLDLLLAHACP